MNNAYLLCRYFRGIRNPIGLKCGPTLQTEELLRLLDILDPDKEPGKLSLICRYGADKVRIIHFPHLLVLELYVVWTGRRMFTETY